ncbi:Sporulation protein YlmC, PRC-barrel domain family [Methanococcoides vulcani]|uniref:Sporulation protein YlmC, PRC-barrel domain family n=2 Tax=Methanococcoides TaxID=2225 RepID=A0A1H9Y201_9EURY|nr:MULTISPECIES: PRC-barrel domain-containing protein [Methanococcoides]KGK98250.1 photosystem reaction center subunit H [Methanococcoides methylutens]UGV40174.1 PRC-barrel domain-containing protein [Methanococcoides orientis]SES62834.1 Sporulation protein YlmC, PRC-barrel domain family [Methanococcoides vulcani]
MRADITSLFGLNVYTNQGTYVGKVNDLVFDVDERVVSGLALSDINRDIFDVATRGVILPYRWVVTTGDIVLIRDIVKRFKKPAKEEEKED